MTRKNRRKQRENHIDQVVHTALKRAFEYAMQMTMDNAAAQPSEEELAASFQMYFMKSLKRNGVAITPELLANLPSREMTGQHLLGEWNARLAAAKLRARYFPAMPKILSGKYPEHTILLAMEEEWPMFIQILRTTDDIPDTAMLFLSMITANCERKTRQE